MNVPVQKLKQFFSFLVKIGLSAGLMGYLFTKIDVQKTFEILRSADLLYIGYAAAVYAVIYVILLYRWFLFIRALDLIASVSHLIQYYFIGLFGNLFLPSSIGGDIIKILGLCKDGLPKPKVVASVLLDRLSGFAGIVVVAVAAYTFGRGLIEDDKLLIPITLMGGCSLIFTAVLFNERNYSFCCAVFKKIPKIQKGLMNLHYDVALLKDKKLEGLKAIALSCVTQTILAVSFYLTAIALHQDISMIYFLIFIPIICVVSSFPSIGGLGVREAGAAYLFAKVGVDSGVAVSLSLINFMFMVAAGLIGGVLYVITLSHRRIQRAASDACVSTGEV